MEAEKRDPGNEVATTAACNTAERSNAGGQEIKPLDRKRDKMKENLLVLHLTLLTAFKYV